MSSSLPSSRETPSEPFGRPSFSARGPGPGEALAGPLGDQVALALDAHVLLERHEDDAGWPRTSAMGCRPGARKVQIMSRPLVRPLGSRS